MSRISKGAVARAAKNVKRTGETRRQWNMLGRWKASGMYHHIYTDCRVIYMEWAGRDYRWVHDNRGDVGLCPVCENVANRQYMNSRMKDAYLVGEYKRRAQALVDEAVQESMGLPA